MPGVQKPHCEPCMRHHRRLHGMQAGPAARGEVLHRDHLRAVRLSEEEDALAFTGS